MMRPEGARNREHNEAPNWLGEDRNAENLLSERLALQFGADDVKAEIQWDRSNRTKTSLYGRSEWLDL